MVATLGILNINKKVLDLPNLIDNTNPVQTKIGIKYFELSNHASAPLSTGLGNVLTTISDRKIEHGSGSTVEYYTADIISATDYYPFGFAMDKRNFSSSDYRFGFNGMEKDDEMIGSGNSYTTYFRQYDPRLGRWKCMDPKVLPHESPYISMSNNPIIFLDPLGDKVINARKKEKDEAEAVKNEKKAILDSFGDNTKAKGYRKANRQYKRASRKYDTAKDKFDEVEGMIEDLKKYNEKLFNELDNNLYAEDGSVVDVYVDIVPNLYSDTYSRMSTLREFEERRDLDGLTVLTPTKSYTSVDFQTGESKTITQFTSPYGKNTVLLVVDRLVVDKGMTLSHEGGHALYNVRNLSYYIEWLTKNPGASVGGHGGGNPSGKEAD